MSDEAPDDKPKKKGGAKPLLFGLVGALALGGGAGYAVYSGMVDLPIPGLSAKAGDDHGGGHDDGYGGGAGATGSIATTRYVPLDPITIPIGRGGRAGQLRATLTVETDSKHEKDIEERKYRIIDSLNSFLRAVEEDDLRTPANMERLRAQMLRRVSLEAPLGAVNDLLIAEFLIL